MVESQLFLKIKISKGSMLRRLQAVCNMKLFRRFSLIKMTVFPTRVLILKTKIEFVRSTSTLRSIETKPF